MTPRVNFKLYQDPVHSAGSTDILAGYPNRPFASV